MLTLESRRFPVLGEVSCLIAKETEQGVTITCYIIFDHYIYIIFSCESLKLEYTLKHKPFTVIHFLYTPLI